MGCLGEPQHLDAALVTFAQEAASLRLRLGQLLEVIARGAVFQLGFSSLNAYAVERCERSVRWAESARCLARRLEELPQLRQALATAKVSSSMGELLARVATPASEGRWLQLAQSRTVRQMRMLVTEALAIKSRAAKFGAATSEGGASEGGASEGGASEGRTSGGRTSGGGASVGGTSEGRTSEGGARAAGIEEPCPTGGVGDAPAKDDGFVDWQSGDSDEICILTCTVDREEAWLFEATRCLLEQLGVSGAVEQAEALLAEAQGTLLASLPEGTLDLDGASRSDLERQRWQQQLRREEAEASCEKGILAELLSMRRRSGPAEGLRGVAHAAALGIEPLEHASCTALDQQVRALTARLAGHELELSLVALRFHRANGWRRLGYATEAQYARERLGLSRSSLVARRALALRLEKLPGVAAALGAGQIGVEAAVKLVRIATPKTEAAWVERARRRTIKHLREEVAAALTAVRLSGEKDCLPPEDGDMKAFQTLEQKVKSGRLRQRSSPGATPGAVPGATPGATASPSSTSSRQPSEPTSDARRAWCAMLGSLASWLDGALQMSAAAPGAPAAGVQTSAGRVTLRLRMSRDSYRWWRSLEVQARPWLPPGVSWLRFLCLCVWQAWRHLLGTDVAYGHIYIRDRFRCTSPVCNRRDVTPHHLEFRSAGGSDDDHNLASVCTWCHLRGIHGGRIRALGRADHIRWELGPRNAPCIIVDGRERMAA